MENEGKPFIWRDFAMTVSASMAAIVVGRLLIEVRSPHWVFLLGSSLFGITVAAWIIFLVPFGLMVVHELAHLATGWLFRYGFEEIRFGPLLLIREQGRYRIRLHSGSLLGGHCGMDVWKGSRSPFAYIVHCAAGMAATTAIAVWALLTYFAYDARGEPRLQWLFLGMLALYATSWSFSVHRAGGHSDIGLILGAWQNRRIFHRQIGHWRLEWQLHQRTPEFDWDEQAIEALLSDRCPPELYGAGALYRFYQSAMHRDLFAARHWLDEMYSLNNEEVSKVAHPYAALFFSHLSPDSDKAAFYLALLGEDSLPRYTVLTAKAAFALLQRCPEDAAALAGQARDVLDDSAYPAEREWIDEITQEADKALRQKT